MRGFKFFLTLSMLLVLALILFLAKFLELGQEPLSMSQAIGLGDKVHAQKIFADHALLGQEPKITWLGHASMLIEWKSKKILCDPYFGNACVGVPRRWTCPIDPEYFGPVDIVLISHAHRDHMDPKSISRISHIGTIVIPRGTQTWLGDVSNLSEVIEIDPDQVLNVGPFKFTALKMDHGGHRQHPFRSSNIAALGYILEQGSSRIFWAGDTGSQVDVSRIKEHFHPEGAILPIGAYLPEWPIGMVHLNPHQALDWAEALGVKWVMPTHFGTFRLSWDQTDEALPWFLKEAAERHIRVALAPVYSEPHPKSEGKI